MWSLFSQIFLSYHVTIHSRKFDKLNFIKIEMFGFKRQHLLVYLKGKLKDSRTYFQVIRSEKMYPDYTEFPKLNNNKIAAQQKRQGFE